MSIIEAILLGILQGLTEFLPVSSSGHLEIGKLVLGVEVSNSLAFTVAVHGATVLSTLTVFRKDIANLILGLVKFRMNTETRFALKIILSMLPVAVVGVLWKEEVEALFNGNMILVGSMLLLTATLLALPGLTRRKATRPITYADSLLIGLAQAIAVLPGLSRSGSTIAAGLLLGNNRDEVARFSFLMVIIPILGANALDLVRLQAAESAGVGMPALAAGFISAYITGYLACSWMISLVKKGKLIWFAFYCAVLGVLSMLSTAL